METSTQTTEQQDVQQTLGMVQKLVVSYGVVGTLVLSTDIVVALTGKQPTSFMWGRTGGVLASAVVIYWLTGRAAQGSRPAFLRLRTLAMVLPVVTIALDLVPSLPAWFVTMQIAGALVLALAALVINRTHLRAAFVHAKS